MSDPPAETVLDPSTAEGIAVHQNGGKRMRWFELCLVLLVSCGGPVVSSLYLLRRGPTLLSPASRYRWTVGTMQEIAALLVLSYVLSRRNLGFKDLGLRWSLRDVGVGLFLALAGRGAYFIGYVLLRWIHVAIYGTAGVWIGGASFFGHLTLLSIPYLLLSPFFEEMIVRAYLMTEVIELTGSTSRAVALSVLLQFSYHLYYGWTGAAAVSLPFLIYALYYRRSRQALPIIVAHETWNLWGFIRAW